MTTVASDLESLNAQAKVIRDKQAAVKAKLNEGKEIRKEVRTEQAECRREAYAIKQKLTCHLLELKQTFSINDPEQLAKLADAVMEEAAKLSGIIRKFGVAAGKL